jgi:hypothetical protein
MNTPTTFREIYTLASQFKIPSYQRPYSWGDKEVGDFLEDLASVRGSYYLGHFLFEADPETPQTRQDPTRLYLIDGQQRLTTCTIFFSALCEEIERRTKAGEVIALDTIEVRRRYLYDDKLGVDRLQTVDVDRNRFSDEILRCRAWTHEAATRSQERLRAARVKIVESLKTKDSETMLHWAKLIEGAAITTNTMKDKRQATQVFAFQNDRGVKLSKLEIVKSYLMLQVHLAAPNPAAALNTLEFIEGEMKEIYQAMVEVHESEDSVINHYWRARSEKGFDAPEVVAGVKGSFANVDQDRLEWIKDFFRGLALAFQTVRVVEADPRDDFKHLRYLKQMALSFPFFIRARLGSAHVDLCSLARVLENMTFRIAVCGGRARSEARLNHCLNKLQRDGVVEMAKWLVHCLKHEGWWCYWNDRSMKESLEGWMYQNRADDYLLWRYELSLWPADYSKPLVTFEGLISNESIEHIAPRTPTEGKPVERGYGPYSDIVNPNEGIASGNWLNKIGNLMLISRSHNSSIGNFAFERKLASYGRNSPLRQQWEIEELATSSADGLKQWDKHAIERRGKKIVEAAMKLWSLDKLIDDL